MEITFVGWSLGVFFFVFIFAAIAYIVATKPRFDSAEHPEQSAAESKDAPAALKENHAHRFVRAFQIEHSPQAFVNYPFGVRVVFPTSYCGRSEAISPSRLGDCFGTRTVPRNDTTAFVPRSFQESDYIRWAQPEQDPHLVVTRGHIEFESADVEPNVCVSVQFNADAFESSQVAVKHVLRRDAETIFSFWLTPLKEQSSMLTVAVSNGKSNDALATASLVVPVEHFPIRLR